MTVFLTNGFSPSMLKLEMHSKIKVEFEEINKEDFCKMMKSTNDIVNAIGHQSTINLINTLCSTQFGMNRIGIVVNKGDIILALILTTRLEEGRILKENEIMKFLEEGKIKFIKVSVL